MPVPMHIRKSLLTYPHLSKFDYLTMARALKWRMADWEAEMARALRWWMAAGMDGGDGKSTEVRDVTKHH